MAYIPIPIETDAEDVLNDIYTQMQILVPGWTPANGNLDVWLMQAIAAVASESRDVASQASMSIFRWFGASLVGLPPVDAASAYTTTTWTVIDTAGYTIDAGTQVGITDALGNVIPFETWEDYTIPPGQNATPAGAIQVVATIPGADGNSLGGVGTVIQLIDPLAFVTQVVTTAVTAGGTDAELDEDYLNRLNAELQLLAPRPILPNDFAVFARNIPGVWRALAIDLYSPGPPANTNVPRCTTVVAIDQAGVPVSTAVKNAIDADLQARREVNFLVYEADATVTQIDVNYTVVALPNQDKPTLKTSVDGAVTSFLSPATWGTTQEDTRAWRQQTIVRYLELAQAINEVIGVDYISALTFGIHSGTIGSVDVTLPGIAPLPKPGTITGVVN